MKIRKILCIIIPLLALVLELLPYGAVLNFASEPGSNARYVRQVYSYFSLVPFGYANFGPLVTAIITCILIPFSVLAVIFGKDALRRINCGLCALGVFTSLLLLLLFGKTYLTVIGIVITILFVLSLILWTKDENQ